MGTREKLKALLRRIERSPLTVPCYYMLEGYYALRSRTLGRPRVSAEDRRNVEESLTFMYKSFNRQRMARRLLRSIRSCYPKARVITGFVKKCRLIMNTLFIKLIGNVTLVNKVEKDAYYILSLRKRINKSKTKLGGALLKHRYHKLCIKYGCFLPMKAQLGNDVVFPHGLFGVFVSQDASIGNSCCIFQHVTIGSNTLEDSVGKGAPIIGNNVYIGAGAKIIGNCKIGDNVRIGANTVVTKDIPDNTTVIGSNNRIIKHSVKLSNTFIPK